MTQASSVEFTSKSNSLWLTFSLATTVVVLLLSLNLFGIIDPSDGFYSEGAREMLLRNDFVTPYLNFQPFYEKPIGIYWLIICSYKLLGVNEMAARLPSALAAVACAAFTVHILCKLKLRRLGLMSACIMLTTPLFAIVSRLSLTDMPLCACLTVAIFAAFYFSSHEREIRYLLVCYFALGAAVLIKGPVVLIHFGLVLFSTSLLNQIYEISNLKPTVEVSNGSSRFSTLLNTAVKQLAMFNLRSLITKYRFHWGLAIILSMTLPWYLYENHISNGAFFQEFFFRQHIQRFQGTVNHPEPWYFFLPVFLAGTLPWNLFFIFIRPTSCRRLIFSNNHEAKLLHLCISWIACTIFLFSLSTGKLATYIVPSMVPFSILLSINLRYLKRFGDGRRILVGSCLTTGVLIATLIGISQWKNFWHDTSDLQLVWLAVLIAPLFNVVAFKQKTGERRLNVTVAGIALTLSLAITAGLHCFDEERNRGLRNLYLETASRNCSVANFMRFMPGATFYTHKPICNLSSVDDYNLFLLNTPPPHMVIVEDSTENLIKAVCPGLKLVRREGHYSLMQHL